MSAKPITRKLRSGGACQVIENPFQSDHFRRILPPEIYNRISGIPSLNCDRISQVVFEAGSGHRKNLEVMRGVNEGSLAELREESSEHMNEKKRKYSLSMNDFGE